MRYVGLCLIFFLISHLVGAQENFSIQPSEPKKEDFSIEKVKIDYNAYLKNGQRYSNRSSTFTIQLPIYGKMETFQVTKNDVLDEETVRQNPDLLTFDLTSVDNKNIYGALTLSNLGLYATIIHNGKMVSIYPDDPNTPNFHHVEYGIQPDIRKMKQFCGHDHSMQDMIKKPSPFNGLRTNQTMGAKKHVYDVAIICTGEFYLNNGNTDSAVRIVIVNTLNAISAIFSFEMSIRLSTTGTLIYMYNDPSTDPFIPDQAGGTNRPDQAGAAVAARFTPNSRYDIGHVFHQHKDGDGWGNGGIAQLESVCSNSGTFPAKGRGWSGAYTNVGNGWINLATHEFGHQFGANHTFNGIGGSCTDAIAEHNSYEIGSGTTIMSYNGICDPDQNIPSSDAADNYFHIKSLEEMYDFVYNRSGGPCGNPSNSTNALPSVVANDCGAVYRIPKNTPFYLEAKGSFTDSDSHTYCWEEIDEDGPNSTSTQGWIGAVAASSTKAPLFRSYPPSTVPYRYFPTLTDLAKNIVNPFDVLPNTARELNFNVSMRDNVSSGGAVANDDIKITVENSGPFVVTRPIGGETLVAGMSENFTWNTNGSNGLCSKIRIKLSMDEGKSYSLVLAENVDYASGSYNLTLPATISASNTARIMLECMDYSCFKIFNVSRSNFTINSTCIAPVTLISPTTSKSLLEGDPGLLLNLKSNVGKIITNISGSVRSSDLAGNLVYGNNTAINCGTAGNDVKGDIIFFTVDVSGSYTIAHGYSGSAVLNLFIDGFTGTNCTNFVSSSAVKYAGDNFITTEDRLTANLIAGKYYYLFISSFSETTPALPFSYNITFPNKPAGANVYDGVSLPLGYNYTYVAVNKLTNKIEFQSSTSDFTQIMAGTFCVYGVAYNSNNMPDTWIGKTLVEIINNGNCLVLSSNCVDMTVLPACRIDEIVALTQTPCEAGTNDFTQTLTITYNRAPTIGQISVNGQLFNITTSPQTIVLTGLESDGTLRDVNAFFTASTDCKLIKTGVFTAPPNCCPLSFELGADIDLCVGDTYMIDAGSEGVSYIWRKDGVDMQVPNTSKTINVTISGEYEVEVTHSSGCKKTDRVKVTFNPLPVVVIADNQRFCEGETYTISANVTGHQSIAWYKDGVLIPGQSGKTLDITTGGLYKLVALGEFDCKGFDETTVTMVPKPKVDLGPDLDKCTGDTAVLNAGLEGTSFVWYRDNKVITGASEREYEAIQTGLYKVVVKNADQCQSDDEVNIRFFTSPAVNDFPQVINICQGESNKITAVALNFNMLQWYYDNNIIPGANTLSFNVLNSGLYTIEATNNAGLCKTRKSVNVEIRSLPVVNLGDPTLVSCIGNPVVLDAGGDGTKYVWSKDGVVQSTTDRMLTTSNNGLYKVTVTNQFNCSSTDEIALSFIVGPTLSLNGDATICDGETHNIVATTNATNPEVKWYDAVGVIAGANSLIYGATKAGTYRVAVKGGTPACEVSSSVTIKVNPRPAFNLGNDRTLCTGDTPPVLNAGANNTSYTWTLNGAALASTQSVTADKSGLYVVTVNNSFNCSRTEQVRITYAPKPTLTMLAKTYDLCAGSTLDINVVSDGTKFEWKKGTNIIAGQSGKSIKITEAGTYSLFVSNAMDCKTDSTFVVTSRALPVVDLGIDFNLCPSQSKVLNAGSHTKYVWSDNTTAATLTVKNDQTTVLTNNTYKVTVTNQYSCTAQDSVKGNLYPIVVSKIVADQPGVCNGEPVKLTASGGQNYAWTDPGGSTLSTLTGAETIASPTTTTTYSVIASDGICPSNKDTSTIEIKVFEAVNISAGKDTCVVEGRTIRLNAVGGVSYRWNNTSLIVGASNIANPEVKPIDATTFVVTITDLNGCEFTDSVSVCVKKDNFKPISIITPNGDGMNDELYFGNLNEYPDNQLKIFNRWGNVIFEADGYQVQGALFNGTKNGEKLPPDTYYYILTFGDRVIKSALTIMWD